MHEVSLCRQLAAAVTRATRGRTVETVYVTVGDLRQVVPEALEHAWTFVVRDTPLADSRLEMHRVPAVLVCDDCGTSARLGRQLGFDCPACASGRTHLTSGEEFVLTAVDVQDVPDTPASPAPAGLTNERTPDGSLSPP
ncbi:MAG: hydrogenase maturation nickel metallochaperone HypA [Micrococcales bacterium]|nr:hydrogenase maturation nickel metallochaperone HypA [Micrococcales bacterium]